MDMGEETIRMKREEDSGKVYMYIRVGYSRVE